MSMNGNGSEWRRATTNPYEEGKENNEAFIAKQAIEMLYEDSEGNLRALKDLLDNLSDDDNHVAQAIVDLDVIYTISNGGYSKEEYSGKYFAGESISIPYGSWTVKNEHGVTKDQVDDLLEKLSPEDRGTLSDMASAKAIRHAAEGCNVEVPSNVSAFTL